MSQTEQEGLAPQEELPTIPSPDTTVQTEEGYFEHVITEQDVNLNPGEDLVAGETVLIAEEPEPVASVEVPVEVEPEILDLIERYKDTHGVKVYNDGTDNYWEVFLVHKSSLCTHQTCNILREHASNNLGLGFHKFTSGDKESVLAVVKTW